MENSQWKHRFVIGLSEFGLTFEEVKQNWKYAGGNKGRHYNYWILLYGEDKKMPLMKMSASVSIRSKRTAILRMVRSFWLWAIVVSSGS